MSQFQNRTNKIVSPVINTPLSPVELNYYGSTQTLIGEIDGLKLNLRVYSGGGRGHKVLKNPPNIMSQRAKDNQYDDFEEEWSTRKSHLATTKEKKDGTGYMQRGGTLPPGKYTCIYVENHHIFKKCIFLDRPSGDDGLYIYPPVFLPLNPKFLPLERIPHYRDNDFFIHGSGPKGSDGCLVFPQESNEIRLLLNAKVKNFNERKVSVILNVKNVAYKIEKAGVTLFS